ncbi:hypothetical protein MRB53_024587 [Persea americana]|uniref:Uncharacterized protein n=1 Tax=Persea americana TaxID=3435 RepID=A0ACC2LCU3_PERAE|nr:hypothetical protein MRB53_024587 [Persea americana]
MDPSGHNSKPTSQKVPDISLHSHFTHRFSESPPVFFHSVKKKKKKKAHLSRLRRKMCRSLLHNITSIYARTCHEVPKYGTNWQKSRRYL